MPSWRLGSPRSRKNIFFEVCFFERWIASGVDGRQAGAGSAAFFAIYHPAGSRQQLCFTWSTTQSFWRE